MSLFSVPSSKLKALQDDLEGQTRRVQGLITELEALNVEIRGRFRELDQRLEGQDKAIRLMAEEMDERIDRGNKIWRKIRASEYYERQREDSEEDEQPGLDLRDGNGEGGQGEGMPALHPRLGRIGRPLTPAQEMGKALARRIAGLE